MHNTKVTIKENKTTNNTKDKLANNATNNTENAMANNAVENTTNNTALIKETYAKAIIEDLLKLRESDALSINTDEQDLDFAKDIANMALDTTKTIVKIVVTDHGKPTQVLEFDPAPPACDPRGFAMLRLSHESSSSSKTKALSNATTLLDLSIDKEDLVAVQKMGHLAEPVMLNRRISVPWCVATVHEDLEKWEKLHKKVALNIAEQTLATDYRKKYLEHSDSVLLHITGNDTDFTVKVPEGARFIGGTQVLPSGRTFLTGLDFDMLSFITDCNSLDGHFKAKANVLGKEYEGTFVFKDGILTDWTHTKEIDVLLDFDENLKKPGYFSFRDKEFILHLGGSVIEGLEKEPEEESLIPQYFNKSLYTLALRLEEKLSIFATNCDGNTIELVRKGFFLQ